MQKIILLFFCLSSSLLFAISPFYKGALEGFYYYQEGEEDEGDDNETEEAVSDILTGFQRELMGRLQKAVVFPTKKNVKSFLDIQNRAIENSEKFAKIWSQIILEDALLSGQLTNPTASYAIHKRKQIEATEIETFIEEKKEDCVLLFFFHATDLYSQAAAEMVAFYTVEIWKTNWKAGLILSGLYPASIQVLSSLTMF